MPHSPVRTARPAATLAEAAAVLREHGGRVSTSRRAVLTILFQATGPLAAETIANTATPALDVPATYRNLEHLESLGLVRHVHLGHGPGLYELEQAGEHEYALCEACGRTASFSPAELDAARQAVANATGYTPRFTHFPLSGLCADCSASR